MENQIIGNPYASYGEFKQSMDQELQKTAQSFVRIGWLLKVAKETDILKESGYSSMGDFAKAEYGLDASQTSRFIAINDRYGDPEKPMFLLPKYEQYGYSKLSEILTLPEQVAEEITPEYTKEEIREIKTEIKEEEKISDLEVMMEPANDAKGNEMNLAAEVLHEYYRDPEKAEQYCELLKKYHELADQDESEADEEKAIRDILAPAGYATIMARIPQKGKYMISIKGNDPVTVINIRSQEKEESSWKEFVPDVWSSLGEEIEGTPEENWEHEYDQKLPEKEAPHAVNTPSEPVKEAPKKPVSKVSVAKPVKTAEKPKKEAQEPKTEPEEPKEENTAQETKTYPEFMTKSMNLPLKKEEKKKPFEECVNPPEPAEVLHGEVTETEQDQEAEPEPAASELEKYINVNDLLFKIDALKKAAGEHKWKTVIITEGWIHEIVNNISREQDRIDEERTRQKEEEEE